MGDVVLERSPMETDTMADNDTRLLDPTALLALLQPALDDPCNGWSIGTFGAIGEFHRDADEPAVRVEDAGAVSMVTARGAIRIAPRGSARVMAYDIPGSDPDTWSSELALCMPAIEPLSGGVVTPLGPDHQALRATDRTMALYDLGIGLGAVRFCVRTTDPHAIEALHAAAGQAASGDVLHALMAAFLHAQPHRVLLSPAGRIEVTAPIPMPDGRSPEGPHTHLLPALLASGRTHSANTPIPPGWQPILMLHPPGAWRDGLGRRTPYSREADDASGRLFQRFGLADERALRGQVEAAIAAGQAPQSFPRPSERRARAHLRVVLRRLAAAGSPGPVAAWRALHDRPAVTSATAQS